MTNTLTPSPHRWLVLALVSLALAMIVVDMTILYTALPTLTHDLMATAKQKLWIMNMYPLVVAGLLPGAGAIGDRWGHRRIFMGGLVVFGVASLWAAYSPTPASLIGARALLACGAALMMPATLAIIRHSFPDEKERGFAIGVWAAVASGGAALGPVVGGFMLAHFWWGSVFLVNVPIVLLALVFVYFFIEADAGDRSRSLDAIGSVLVLLGLIGVTYAVKAAAQAQSNALEIAATGLAGVVFLVFFALRQRRIHNPLIDFSLFKNRDFSAGVLAAVIVALALVGFQLAFSQWLQLVRGFSPLQAAYYMLPMPIAAFVAGPISGGLLTKMGGRAIINWGLLLCGLGLLSVIFTFPMPTVYLVLSLVAFGFGAGFAITGASSSIMFNAPAHKAGMAASLEEVSYELGGSFGIALLGSLMTATYTGALQLPADMLVPASVFDSLDEALIVVKTLPLDAAQALAQAASQAFERAFVTVTACASGLVLLAFVWTALLRKQPGAA